MKNPINRLYKPDIPSRTLNLSFDPQDPKLPSAECEVTEYDHNEGWEQWLDSVFVQDFEDSVLTATAPAYQAGR